MKIADAHFFDSVRRSQRVLVVLFGGLGDIVHSVPALRAIRRAFADSRVDVLVSTAFADLVEAAVTVDRVLPHEQHKTGWSGHNLQQFWRLFRSRYDLCINLWGNNHSSVVALSTAARVRLVRRPYETWKRGWRWCHTHAGVYPQLQEPMHRQWTMLLEQLGFAVEHGLSFRLDAERWLPEAIAAQQRGRYLHFSPSASEPAKELALAATLELVRELASALPDLPLVITSTRVPRHQQRLRALLEALPRPPLAVFPGELTAAQLFAIIQESALHVSADSGPLHMAVAAQTPSVTWFQENPYIREYLPPTGGIHHAFISTQPRGDGITDIPVPAIVEQCVKHWMPRVPIPGAP